MESFKVLVVLASAMSALAKTNDSTLAEKCFPPKNMCDLDTDSCMVGDMYKRVSDCNFVDGPGLVPKGHGPTKYWITISDEYRDEYPHNTTYSVYRYKLQRREDEETPHLNPIPGCCGLTLTDKNCVLPKHHEEEGLVAIAAIATAVTDKHWYCLWDIEEYNVFGRLCDENMKLPCIEFEDGFPRMRARIIPMAISLRDEVVKADYCFFSAPANIATRVIKDGEMNFSHKKYFPTSRRPSNCSLVSKKNGRVHELAKRYTDLPQEGVICYYSLFPSYYPEWNDVFRCYIVQRDNINDRNFKSNLYIPVVIGALLCLLLAFVVCCVLGCRRRQDTIRNELKHRVPSSIITRKNEYYEDDNTSQNTLTTKDGNSQKESFSIEYEIKQDVPTESDEVLFKAKLMDKSGYQWPNEKEMQCYKFDMLSYIQARQDIN